MFRFPYKFSLYSGKIYFISSNHFNNFFYTFIFITHIKYLLLAIAYNVLWASEVLVRGFGRSATEPDTHLLADPKGKSATAGEEFRTPPKVSVTFNHSYFFKDFLNVFRIFLKDHIMFPKFFFSMIAFTKSTFYIIVRRYR